MWRYSTMPYIDEAARTRLAEEGSHASLNVGELTYLITKLIQRYVREHGIRYATIAQVLGALQGATFDFVRRVVTPYEAAKERENGDVWKDTLDGRIQ
jgi:hypothetical protein